MNDIFLKTPNRFGFIPTGFKINSTGHIYLPTFRPYGTYHRELIRRIENLKRMITNSIKKEIQQNRFCMTKSHRDEISVEDKVKPRCESRRDETISRSIKSTFHPCVTYYRELIMLTKNMKRMIANSIKKRSSTKQLLHDKVPEGRNIGRKQSQTAM